MHLRDFLAPALSKKLLMFGDDTAAAAALRGLERALEELPNAAELAKADIEITQGDISTAQSRLEDIITSNDQQSAEALIRYVNTQLDAEVQISQDIATLVEAYAMEMRSDPLGRELQRAHVLALAKSGQFDTAFNALESLEHEDEVSDPEPLYSTLVLLLSKNASNTTFLKHAFIAVSEPAHKLQGKTADALARRLMNLGFYSEANAILSTRSGTPITKQRRLLLAELSLNLSRPRATLAYLSGMSGDQANRLRAQANLSIGDYDTAYELFFGLGDQDLRKRSAWLSENWDALVDPDDPAHGSVSEIVSSTVDFSDTSDGVLGRVEDALMESATAREAIEQLLSGYSDDGDYPN
ncbi:hypothetical protein GCM10007385_01460 [Tateyamaria omphalii]|nr:hypothetical protein GCM10007385_01460 [Tateyamaria omphalii]